MLYRIGIVGCGTVGRGFLEILDRKAAALEVESGFQARIVAITDKVKGSVICPQGLDVKKTLKALEQGWPLSSVDPEAALPNAPSAAEVQTGRGASPNNLVLTQLVDRTFRQSGAH